jgi:hypothetical protein
MAKALSSKSSGKLILIQLRLVRIMIAEWWESDIYESVDACCERTTRARWIKWRKEIVNFPPSKGGAKLSKHEEGVVFP